MEAPDAKFLAFLGFEQAQLIIPIYQRLYSWEQNDCEII